MRILFLYEKLSLFSVIDDTTKEIVYRDYVDISVAVATPKVTQVYYDVSCQVAKGCFFILMFSLFVINNKKQ